MVYCSFYMPTDDLYHHGIRGQKWGVRRYQNADGTLTADGKKRLEAYKTREESEAIDRGRKYRNMHAESADKLKKKMSEQEAAGKTRDYEKTKQKYDKTMGRLERSKSITEAELEKIKNMTYDQMRSEKMKSTIEIGIYIAGIAAPLPLSDVLAVAIVGDPYNNKTKRRTGESYYG